MKTFARIGQELNISESLAKWIYKNALSKLRDRHPNMVENLKQLARDVEASRLSRTEGITE